jgi:hypothetical protein
MKKISTYLLFLTIGLAASAQQTSPMISIGDVYNAGAMRSDGGVYLKASASDESEYSFARFDNTASATLACDTLILYSNDERDALLRNNGSVTASAGSGNPKEVRVRKKFKTADDWYHVSFPMNITHVVKPGDPVTLQLTNGAIESAYDPHYGGQQGSTVYGHYYTCFYNAELTADSAYREATDADGVKRLNIGWVNGKVNQFDAGKGYMFAVEGGGSYTNPGLTIDFVATDATIGTKAFNTGAKTVPLDAYHSPHSDTEAAANGGIFYTVDTGSGWNYIGNLNTTLFALTKANLSTTLTDISGGGSTSRGNANNGVVYFRKGRLGQSGFQSIDVGTSTVSLRPYVPYYVQLDTFGFANEFRLTNPGATNPFTSPVFTYDNTQTGALLIDTVGYTGLFRSSAAYAKVEDYFQLTMTDNSDQTEPTSCSLRLGDYSDIFVVREDALALSAGPDANMLYSIGKYYDGVPVQLFKNSVTMTDENRNTKEIPLGFIAPRGGTYTIDLKWVDWNRATNAILLDTYTGAQTDLIQQPYTFTTGATTSGDDNRFILFASFHGLPIITPNAVQIYGYVQDGSLTVVNVAEGDRVRVLDLAGRTVALGNAVSNEFRCPLNQKGVYMVTVKGRNNASLKVINK